MQNKKAIQAVKSLSAAVEAVIEKTGLELSDDKEKDFVTHEVCNQPFTKEMKETYTILVPMMLPIHFPLILTVFSQYGYNVELLDTTHRGIVDEGLKNVHNDTCYPALLVIGQMLDALKSGKYDLNKTALMITQTGGGCRASNYIHLLRKALEKNNMTQVPVISLNMSNLESQPGFKFTKEMVIKAIYACIYGDMVMYLANQCRPYEIVKGHTDKVVEQVLVKLSTLLQSHKYINLRSNFMHILDDFKTIGRQKTEKVKVGIVGEIYMKYAPLGNNKLEEYLVNEDAEVVMTGVLDFFLYSFNNQFVDAKLYKEKTLKQILFKIAFNKIVKCQEKMSSIIKKHSDFRPPATFKDVQKAAEGYISQGVKMGEGWLLTGEMVEMIESGINNIVCAQPFGCLPNHIVAKGMIRAIKNKHQDANIVAVDYDPGATKTNQENRIKLMLANAKGKLKPEKCDPIVVVDYGDKANADLA